MIRPNLITILEALTSAVAASAEPLCSLPLEGGGQEGSWRIPEQAFTEEAARTELTKLEALLGPDGEAVDSVAWETSFIYIEGWYLKRMAQAAIQRSEPEPFLSDFCSFMRDRAYVRH